MYKIVRLYIRNARLAIIFYVFPNAHIILRNHICSNQIPILVIYGRQPQLRLVFAPTRTPYFPNAIPKQVRSSQSSYHQRAPILRHMRTPFTKVLHPVRQGFV